MYYPRTMASCQHQICLPPAHPLSGHPPNTRSPPLPSILWSYVVVSNQVVDCLIFNKNQNNNNNHDNNDNGNDNAIVTVLPVRETRAHLHMCIGDELLLLSYRPLFSGFLFN